MSNVTLQIGGRDYTVACAEGEEGHISMLGRLVDRKLTDMGNGTGQNEVRTLLFATLLLADELYDAHNKAPPATAEGAVPDPVVIALENLAGRVENLAIHLEGESHSA